MPYIFLDSTNLAMGPISRVTLDQFVYAGEVCGRPSIPPERLLRATLLQLFSSISSERQLVERLEFDLLFRWFVGLSNATATRTSAS